jgi:hypothetical protein
MTCQRCHAVDATRADHCEACIRAEGDARLPYAKLACEALEELGYLDLVIEVRRRMHCFDVPFDYERMMR